MLVFLLTVKLELAKPIRKKLFSECLFPPYYIECKEKALKVKVLIVV